MKTFIICIAAAFGLSFMLYLIITIPVVEFSYTNNGECVAVYSYDENHSCENLPSKYEKVWVK